MLKFTTKKYAFFASCALLSLLLLILSGCDATSDPRVYYQATGSWEGTIDGKSVRGIIAPNGSYHLAVVDVNGDFIPRAGEYVGEVRVVDRENNIGTMSRIYLRDPEVEGDPDVNAEVLPPVTFKLSGTRIYSSDAPIFLDRSGDVIRGEYSQGTVAGRWSISIDDKITNVVVDDQGRFSGDDYVSEEIGANCQYIGTLTIIDPFWNIFTVAGLPDSGSGKPSMTITELPGKNCPQAGRNYSGLAMTLGDNRLWLATNQWGNTLNSTGTFFGNWPKTINDQPPAATMTVNTIPLDKPNEVQTILIPRDSEVVLSALGSSDPNRDPLTYDWTVLLSDTPGDPIIQSEESTVSFTPEERKYIVNLTVDDGLFSPSLAQIVKFEWKVDRFIDCGNGTILDTNNLLNPLFWLKDAGCSDLNSGTNLLVNLDTAKTNVALLAAGSCSLNDGSEPANWRLPLLTEFETIIEKNNSYMNPPALVNGIGNAQWENRDIFTNVGNSPVTYPWIYWTSESEFVENNVAYGYIVDFGGEQNPDQDPWSSYYPVVNVNAVWPVRDALTVDEVNACLQAPAQP